MDTLKAVALIGSLLGIAFTMIEIVIPGDKLKKQIRTVMSMVMLIAVMTPFVKEGLVISVFENTDITEINETKELQSRIDEYYIIETQKQLEGSLRAYLREIEIEADNLVIDTEINEYNFLEVKSVSLSVTDNEREAAETLIKSLIGEQAEVIFT